MDLTMLPLVFAQAQPAAAESQFDVLLGATALVFELDAMLASGSPELARALGILGRPGGFVGSGHCIARAVNRLEAALGSRRAREANQDRGSSSLARRAEWSRSRLVLQSSHGRPVRPGS